jgi:hypothetical protein
MSYLRLKWIRNQVQEPISRALASLATLQARVHAEIHT